MSATSDNKITLLSVFFIGSCLIVSISLYDLSKFKVRSILSASSVPAGKLTFSPSLQTQLLLLSSH